MTNDSITQLSAPVAREAEPLEKMNQASRANEFSLLELMVVLSSRKWLLTLGPICVALLCFAGSYLIKPTFTAAAQLMTPQQQQSSAASLLGSLGGLGAAGGAIAGLKNPADQWVGLLKSRTVADSLVDRFKLVEVYDTKYRFEARKALADSTRIIAGKDGLIDIEVDDTDPKRAADIATAYISELTKLSNTLAVTEAAQRRLFFEKQLLQAKDGLVKAETGLRQSGISESVLKTNPGAAVTAIADARAQISAAEVRLDVMKTQMTDSSPQVQIAKKELASLRQQLSQAEAADPRAAQASGTEYVGRYRDFKYFETLFEMMSRQYELAKSDEAREGAVIQVVDPAEVPEWKSKPKRLLIGIGALFGSFFVLLLYVLTQNAMSNLRQDPIRSATLHQLLNNLRFRRG